MSPDFIVGLISQLLKTAALLIGPLIGVTTLVGLVTSVLQGVTQIQESSLTFVPKLIAAGAVLLVMGGWMLKVLTEYASTLINNIPNYF